MEEIERCPEENKERRGAGDRTAAYDIEGCRWSRKAPAQTAARGKL